MNGLKTCAEVFYAMNSSENKLSSQGGDGINFLNDGSRIDGNENTVSLIFLLLPLAIIITSVFVILFHYYFNIFNSISSGYYITKKIKIFTQKR